MPERRSHRRPLREHLEEDGFTIIEMMVALTVMAVAMVAISGVFFTGLKAASASASRTAATALATRETEAIRAVPYNGIGFYDDQAGRVAAFEGSATISLGSVTPLTATLRLVPTGTVAVGPVNYSVTRHVLWEGASGPSTTYPEAYRKTVVLITWTDSAGRPHEVRQDSIVYPGGLGAYSGPGSVTTTTTTAATVAPTPPTITSVTAPAAPAGETRLDVVWTAPTGGGAVTSYIVQWSTNSSFSSGTASSPPQPPSAISYATSLLAPGTTYHFRVIAYASPSLSSTSAPASGATRTPPSPPPCTVNNLTLTGVGASANQGLSTKTYLQNGNSRLREALNLVVTYSGSCSTGFTVRGVNSGNVTDPGSPYSMAGDGSGTDTGTIAMSTADWSVGVHRFTVLRGGTPVSPAVEKTFLFCSHTNSPSSIANQC